MGTDGGLRVLLALAALLTMLGGSALGAEGDTLGAIASGPGAAGADACFAALGFVALAAGLLLRAVSAEEKEIAARRDRSRADGTSI